MVSGRTAPIKKKIVNREKNFDNLKNFEGFVKYKNYGKIKKFQISKGKQKRQR